MVTEKLKAFQENLKEVVQFFKDTEDKLLILDGEIENKQKRLAKLEQQLAEQKVMNDLAIQKSKKDLEEYEKRTHENYANSQLVKAEAESLKAQAARELLSQQQKSREFLEQEAKLRAKERDLDNLLLKPKKELVNAK